MRLENELCGPLKRATQGWIISCIISLNEQSEDGECAALSFYMCRVRLECEREHQEHLLLSVMPAYIAAEVSQLGQRTAQYCTRSPLHISTELESFAKITIVKWTITVTSKANLMFH
jgi:hypothetical protein